MKERILGRINNVLGYALFILISLITYNFIPVGAIVGTVAFFSMSLPIIFAVGISILTLLIVSPASISVYLIFLMIFVMETILFKPLVSFENRNERKKVGTYLIITMFVIQLINLGIIRSLTFALIMLGVYKIIVNGLSVVFNTDQKIIFADEEWLSVIITTIIAITFNYQIFKNINILGFGLQNVYILLLTIIATIGVIKRGGMISFLSLGIGYIFIRNIVGINQFADVNYKMIYITIFTVLLSIILQFKKKYMLLILWIINLITLSIMYYNISSYIYILIPSIIASIIVLRDSNFDFSNIFNSEFLLGDGSERRLKPPVEEKREILEDENAKKRRAITEKLKKEENIRAFEEKIILDKKIKKLKIYNQIVFFDKIIKNIYLECIKNDINLNIYEICDILNMNNLVVDIEDEEVTKELEVLKQVSTKIILVMYKKFEKNYKTTKESKKEEKDDLQEKVTSIEKDNESGKEKTKNTIVGKIVEINKRTIKSIKDKLLRE
jgi:membrane protein